MIAGVTSVSAQTPSIDSQPSITVQGTGETSAVPDTAYVNIGVQSAGEQAGEVLRDNNRAMEQLLGTLKRRGVEDRDVQTTNFSISPIYERNNRRPGGSGESSTPKITGYRISNQVRVKIADLDNLGAILDEVVGQGANSINGISFDVADPQAVEDEARRAAVKEARRKAELLAEAAGVKVGSPLEIREATFAPRPQGMAVRAMAAESSVPISRGEQQIEATVTVVYQLLR
jgi:hypothetical protein